MNQNEFTNRVLALLTVRLDALTAALTAKGILTEAEIADHTPKTKEAQKEFFKRHFGTFVDLPEEWKKT